MGLLTYKGFTMIDKDRYISSLRGQLDDKPFEHISADMIWLQTMLTYIRKLGGNGFIYRGVKQGLAS